MDYDAFDFERFCSENNILVKVGVASSKIRGLAIYYGGKYLVYINCNMAVNQQKVSTVHELVHIFEDHFNCGVADVEKCEKEVHEIIFKLNAYDIERGNIYVNG